MLPNSRRLPGNCSAPAVAAAPPPTRPPPGASALGPARRHAVDHRHRTPWPPMRRPTRDDSAGRNTDGGGRREPARAAGPIGRGHERPGRYEQPRHERLARRERSKTHDAGTRPGDAGTGRAEPTRGPATREAGSAMRTAGTAHTRTASTSTGDVEVGGHAVAAAKASTCINSSGDVQRRITTSAAARARAARATRAARVARAARVGRRGRHRPTRARGWASANDAGTGSASTNGGSTGTGSTSNGDRPA